MVKWKIEKMKISYFLQKYPPRKECFMENPKEFFSGYQLSVRAGNVLKKAGIFTIEEFLSCSHEDFMNMENSGTKTATELFSLVTQLKYGESALPHTMEEVTAIVPPQEELFTFLGNDGFEYIDTPIENGHFSIRAIHILENQEIQFVSQILALTEEDVYKFPSSGKKTVDEILTAQTTFIYKKADTANHSKKKSAVLLMVQTIVTYLNCKTSHLYDEIYGLFTKYPEIDATHVIQGRGDESFIGKLLTLPSVVAGVKRTLCNALTSFNWGASRYQLEKKLPPFLMDHEFFGDILLNMQNEQLIFINRDALYELLYMSAFDFGKSIQKERERDALLSKIQGSTLEEIGLRYDITRERTRQVIAKQFRSAPRLYEDRYKDLFQTYFFDLNDFVQITKEDETTFHYLVTRYKRGETSWKELLFDDNFPISLQKSAERLSYKDYVFLRGEYVRKRRPELVEYALRTFAKESIDFDFFKQNYNQLLESIGLQDDEAYGLNGRGLENQISSSDLTLRKYGRKFKYYNIHSYDFSSLIDTLDLGSYHDIELSTKKWFTDFPSLMSEFNITDEYELHNLLKKLDPSQDFPELSFGRMPHIEFGTANRAKQALDLLYIHAPISNVDLAELYETTYGVLSQTALANYFGALDQYLHEGVYRIDFPVLSHEMLSALKEMLCEDFYFLSKVRDLYLSTFPHSDENLINPRALKQLGFLVFDEYIISEKFSTAADYFRYCLITDDIVDLNKLPKGTKQIISFYVELYKFRAAYDIIEYEPSQYINIRKLEKAEIRKSDLTDYCKSVKAFLSTPFFTIHSLKQSGFSHKLDNLGFKDHFYGALLAEDKENFTAVRLGNLNRIFTLGKNPFSLGKFLEWVVYSSETLYFDVEDLSDFLKEKYNIIADRNQLPEIVKSTELYYNQLTRKIYADYDVFLETV